MDEIWFEENLYVPYDEIDEEIKNLIELDSIASGLFKSEPQAIVRVSTPRWESLGVFEINGKASKLWKIRLRFQFSVKDLRTKFISAKCECFLSGGGQDKEFPRVYDFFPQDVEEGEARKLTLKFSPKISIFNSEVSLGEIGSDIDIGQVIPIVAGFPGYDDRNPYWELRSGKHPIYGTRDFWLVIEQPIECKTLQLRIRMEGVIQSFWGPVPISTKNRIWENRPLIVVH